MKSYYTLFFCLAITLHNLEEALWLPQWSQIGSAFQRPVTSNEFYFTVLIITALAYLISFLYLIFPKSKVMKWAFIGFLKDEHIQNKLNTPFLLLLEEN